MHTVRHEAGPNRRAAAGLVSNFNRRLANLLIRCQIAGGGNMEPTDNKPKKLVSRWWKIGFFMLLIVFEIVLALVR